MSSPSRAATAAKAVSSLALLLPPTHPGGAANDNGVDPQGDALLRAALRMFAEYGLGAGHRAQGEAEAAFFAGERERYRWWLAVTRTLDRKLAVELAGRMGSHRFGSQALPAR
ncbi:MAG: hypothetical protein Q8R44_06575 [Novosphingobium sp.]|nr:hypothetical protein [Novosphingobium sp.]